MARRAPGLQAGHGPAAARGRARVGWLLRLVVAGLVLAAVVAGGLAGGAWWWTAQPLSLAKPAVELSVEPGTPPRAVAEAWVAAGDQTSPWLLFQWFRWSGDARRIRAGSYEIEPGTTPRSLLDKMVQGREVLETVRLPEGATSVDRPADRLYTVTEDYPSHGVLDANHPLAGMALRIALKVVDVREATDTEIREGSVGDSPLQVLHGAPPDAPLH